MVVQGLALTAIIRARVQILEYVCPPSGLPVTETNNTLVFIFSILLSGTFVQFISPSMFIVNKETHEAAIKVALMMKTCVSNVVDLLFQGCFFNYQKFANVGQ